MSIAQQVIQDRFAHQPTTLVCEHPPKKSRKCRSIWMRFLIRTAHRTGPTDETARHSQILQSRSRIQLHYSRCPWLDIVRAAADFAFYHEVSHQIVFYGFQKARFAVATQISRISVAFDDGADIPGGLPCLVGWL